MKKIFPFLGSNNPSDSFKVLFIAEGYTANENTRFTADCIEFIDKLLAVPPFNLTRKDPHWLSIYSSFMPSNHTGPAIDTPVPANQTLFESSYNVAAGTLTFNTAKIKAYITAEQIKTPQGNEAFTRYCRTGPKHRILGRQRRVQNKGLPERKGLFIEKKDLFGPITVAYSRSPVLPGLHSGVIETF